MTGIERLIAWNEARLDYEIAFEKKRAMPELEAKWRAAQSAFSALTAIDALDAEDQEMEFCEYMREWHEELAPPLIVGFERVCRGE